MLHIFHVDSGRMMTFDMSLALESVAKLKRSVEEEFKIAADKQVLLISGGECLDSNKRVCSYTAGTDTNPIFLFSKSIIENPNLPTAPSDPNSERDSNIEQCLMEHLVMPVSITTLNKRAHLSQTLFENAKRQLSECKMLVHDQHLQQQGWSAVIANLDDLTAEFFKRVEIFQNTVDQYLKDRESYFSVLENFNKDLDYLKKIPLLSVLRENENKESEQDESKDVEKEENKDSESDESKNKEDEESKDVEKEENNKDALKKYNNESEEHEAGSSSQEITLYDWVLSSDNKATMDRLYEHCSRGIQQFNIELFDLLKKDFSKVSSDVANDKLKEVIGLAERLSGLEVLMREATKLVNQQADLAQSFNNNLVSASTAKDDSVLPELCMSHKKQLLMMLDCHKRLTDIKRRCFDAKNELKLNLYHRLRWVMFLEDHISSVDHKIVIYHENLKRLRHHFEVMQQIHSAPVIYFTAVAEVTRRKIFSQNYMSGAADLVCHLVTLHTKEVEWRKKFRSRIEGHFLSELFPGIDDLPPALCSEVPAPFDTGLPNICEDDFNRLKTMMPEMAQLLSSPDAKNFELPSSAQTPSEKEEEKTEKPITGAQGPLSEEWEGHRVVQNANPVGTGRPAQGGNAYENPAQIWCNTNQTPNLNTFNKWVPTNEMDQCPNRWCSPNQGVFDMEVQRSPLNQGVSDMGFQRFPPNQRVQGFAPNQRVSNMGIQQFLPNQRISDMGVQQFPPNQRISDMGVQGFAPNQRVSNMGIQQFLPNQRISDMGVQQFPPNQRGCDMGVQQFPLNQRGCNMGVQGYLPNQRVSDMGVQGFLPNQRVSDMGVQGFLPNQRVSDMGVQGFLPNQRVSDMGVQWNSTGTMAQGGNNQIGGAINTDNRLVYGTEAEGARNSSIWGSRPQIESAFPPQFWDKDSVVDDYRICEPEEPQVDHLAEDIYLESLSLEYISPMPPFADTFEDDFRSFEVGEKRAASPEHLPLPLSDPPSDKARSNPPQPTGDFSDEDFFIDESLPSSLSIEVGGVLGELSKPLQGSLDHYEYWRLRCLLPQLQRLANEGSVELRRELAALRSFVAANCANVALCWQKVNQAAIDQLRRHEDESWQRERRLLAELAGLQEDVRLLEEQLDDAKLRDEQLEETLKEVEEQLGSAQDQRDRKEIEARDLGKKVGELEEALAKSATELKELRKEPVELKEEVRLLKDQLDDAKLRDEELEEVEEQLASVQDQLDRKEIEARDLGEKVGELEEALAKSANELKELRKEPVELKEEVRLLKEQLDDAKLRDEELAEARRALKKVEEQLASVQDQRDRKEIEARDLGEKVGELEEALAKSANELQELRKEPVELKEEVRLLKEQLDDAKLRDEELVEARRALKEVEEQLASVQDHWDRKEIEARDLVEKVGELEEALARSATELEELRKEPGELKEKLVQAEGELKTHREQLTALQVRLEKSDKEMAQLRWDLRCSRLEEEQLREQRRELTEQREAAVREANEEREAAVREAVEEREAAVREANEEREAAVREAVEEREAAVREANEEREAAVREANEQRDAAVREAVEQREAAVREATERLGREHRDELERLRLRFKLMQSDCGGGKLTGEEVAQMQANFELDKQAAVEEAVRRVTEAKDARIEELLLANAGWRLQMAEPEMAQEEDETSEDDDEEEAAPRMRAGKTDVATQKDVESSKKMISVDKCKPKDLVVVVWDPQHDCFKVVQEDKHLYFVHPDSLEGLGLEVREAKPNKLYAIGTVVDKEYCCARKAENRYKVPIHTKFYRVKVGPANVVRPLTVVHPARDYSQSICLPRVVSDVDHFERLTRSQSSADPLPMPCPDRFLPGSEKDEERSPAPAVAETDVATHFAEDSGIADSAPAGCDDASVSTTSRNESECSDR